MQHYLVLSRENYYAEKQNSDKVLPFGDRGPVIMPHRVLPKRLSRMVCDLHAIEKDRRVGQLVPSTHPPYPLDGFCLQR